MFELNVDDQGRWSREFENWIAKLPEKIIKSKVKLYPSFLKFAKYLPTQI